MNRNSHPNAPKVIDGDVVVFLNRSKTLLWSPTSHS